jgi:soluble lytic murein transglycosylase
LRVKTGPLKGELFEPELNIRFGTHYFKRMLRMFSDNVPLALSAYNAGPGRIRRWVEIRNFSPEFLTGTEPVPSDDLWVDELPWNETRFYSKAILRNWMIYKTLYEKQGLRDFYPVEHPVWKRAVKSTN